MKSFSVTTQMKASDQPFFGVVFIILYIRAQLFEGGLAFNPRLNLTRVFILLCSKAFSRIIFSVLFKASNNQLVDKKN